MPRPAAPFLALVRPAAAALILTAGSAAAQEGDAAALFEALGMDDLLPIMREEGIGYGADLENDLFPGRGGADWADFVSEIYEVERLGEAVRLGLEAELDAPEMAAATEFFVSDLGQRIVGFEVAARQALLDEAVEEEASAVWMEMQTTGGPRWDLLTRFEEVNDLIEQNVAGAMTSNYAFYTGLMDGRAFDFEMTEQEILADVWSQEAEIRGDTTDWVFSFTALAYQPLTEAEFEDYVAFSESAVGQALNAALFATFNGMFREISHGLGLGAARYLGGQDI